MDLITWLRAQWDTDEAHAQKDLATLAEATAQGEWNWRPGHNLPYSEVWADDGILTRIHTPRHQADTMAIARLVKAGHRRATEKLAEIDAKRRILDLRDAALADADDPGINRENGITAADQLEALDAVVALLALPMAGREGYQESWRP